MTTGQFIAVLIILGIYLIWKKSPDWTFDNRTSPDGYRTDWEAMNRDTINGMSERDRKIKFNSGGYDIPDNN